MTPPEKSMAAWVIQAVRDVGFPIVVAMALVYMAFAEVPMNVATNRAGIIHVQETLDAHVLTCVSAHVSTQQAIRDSALRTELLMRQICVNTASTDGERTGCFTDGAR